MKIAPKRQGKDKNDNNNNNNNNNNNTNNNSDKNTRQKFNKIWKPLKLCILH